MGETLFTTTIDKTHRILHEIEDSLGWPRDRRQQSYAALRAVLHALRDRLTVEEAAQLGAQLPMLVRGIYYEGWDPTGMPVKAHRDEFLRRVREQFHYDVPGGVEVVVRAVLGVLRRHVSAGEWANVLAALPQDLVALAQE
jgi:uncharacterized protein (DUF2267 family)